MRNDRNLQQLSDVLLLEQFQGVGRVVMDEKELSKYIPPDRHRYTHILGVVERMKEVLAQIEMEEETKELLLQTAFLHDIGYSDKLNQYDYHPLDGAFFVQQCGFPKPVIAAVLFHSGAYESVKKTRPDLVSIYAYNAQWLDETDQLFIDLITYCDLHTSPVGKKISVKERIDDIVTRYGAEHEVSRFMIGNLEGFKQTIERVEQLLVKNRATGWNNQ
jgi:hypothetical protein